MNIILTRSLLRLSRGGPSSMMGLDFTFMPTRQPPIAEEVRGTPLDSRALIAIRVVHTAVWAFMVGCIAALPVAGWLRRFDWAAVLSAIVLLECGVLALNRGRCPLTDVAMRYTSERTDSFDIYLPAWLAKHNKLVFGSLFVVNEVILVAEWLREP